MKDAQGSSENRDAMIVRADDPLRSGTDAQDCLEKISRQVPGMVFQFRLRPDGSSSLPFVSDAIRGIFGVTPAEVAVDASLVFARVHPEDLPVMNESIQESANNMTPWRREFRILRDDGAERWLFGDSLPQREADGSVLWHGFVSDITEQKENEAALKKLNDELEARVEERTAELRRLNDTLVSREEETRSVVEYMVDCVITIDERGIIRSVNHVVEQLFGYTRDELVGENVSTLMAEPDRSLHDGYLEHYCRTGEQRIINRKRDVVGRHKDGTIIPLELAVSHYFVGGQRFFSGILRDIRERLRVMKELEQARLTAEAANRAKSVFLATMSHEIRTPMNGVIGMIDVLQQSSLSGTQQEMVDLIHESAYSLLTIIDDILDFSKIESGRLVIQRKRFCIASVVDSVRGMFDNLARTKGVGLSVEIDAAIPREVLGDAGRLRQILVNLLGNAIKFSSGLEFDGRVLMRVRLVEIGLRRADVEFEVEDNGVGMDQATQDQLFGAFAQADVSTTRRFGGTGLGLAISRHLIGLMDGTISVKSALGRGSCFRVRLPFLLLSESPIVKNVAAVADITPEVIGSVDGRSLPLREGVRRAGTTILVAEDNEINQKVILYQLGQLGLTADIAADGQAALEAWRREEFSLLLTDLRMPRMDGYALASAIRAEENGAKHIPIVVLTANALDGERERCLAAGMDDYLCKPVQMTELAATLRKWLPASVDMGSLSDSPVTPKRKDVVPVDIRVLKSLVGDDPDVVAELLGDFHASAERIIEELNAACCKNQASITASLAHKLKSSAHSVGAMALGDLCVEIEVCAKEGSVDLVAVLCHKIDDEWRRVSEYLKTL